MPGSHQLPGLRTLAQTQPVREGLGLGLGQASRGAANQTGTAATPDPGHCQHTPGPGLLPTTHSRGDLAAHVPHRPPRRPDSPQNTQRRRAGAVGVFYLVLSPRPRPRARGSPSHAHERARRALRGSWVPPSGRPVRRAGCSRRPLPDGWSSLRRRQRRWRCGQHTAETSARRAHSTARNGRSGRRKRAGPESWEVDEPQRRGRFSEAEKPREKTDEVQGKQIEQQWQGRFAFFFFFSFLDFYLVTERRREKTFTFCLDGRQEQGRAQGGERWGKPDPHAPPRGSQPHEGICRRKQ